MTFSIRGRRHEVACLSSFYGFHPGFGFYAFAACMRGCDAGMIQEGSRQAQRFENRLRWTSERIRGYCLNIHYSETHGRALRAIVKGLLNRLSQKTSLRFLVRKLPSELAKIRVVEQDTYDTGLLGFISAFQFRPDLSLAHLAWRYSLDLPFARYRLFQAFSGRSYIGYVILQDMPGGVRVAQADGIEPRLLAGAIVHAISGVAAKEGDRRQVMLLTSHPSMRDVFESVGFRHRLSMDRHIAIGAAKGHLTIPVPTSEWLVNCDWGDRGLSRPFPDEVGS